MESFPSFFFLLCKCGGHRLLCSPGAWPALSMSHVSMTSSGMKRGERSGSHRDRSAGRSTDAARTPVVRVYRL